MSANEPMKRPCTARVARVFIRRAPPFGARSFSPLASGNGNRHGRSSAGDDADDALRRKVSHRRNWSCLRLRMSIRSGPVGCWCGDGRRPRFLLSRRFGAGGADVRLRCAHPRHCGAKRVADQPRPDRSADVVAQRRALALCSARGPISPVRGCQVPASLAREAVVVAGVFL